MMNVTSRERAGSGSPGMLFEKPRAHYALRRDSGKAKAFDGDRVAAGMTRSLARPLRAYFKRGGCREQGAHPFGLPAVADLALPLAHPPSMFRDPPIKAGPNTQANCSDGISHVHLPLSRSVTSRPHNRHGRQNTTGRDYCGRMICRAVNRSVRLGHGKVSENPADNS